MINIRGYNSEIDKDIFYRYKMHKPVIIEQKTNNILNNINEISKDLNRDSKFILNFLKNKLNINIINKNNKIIIPKTTTVEQIQNSLYEYIEKYILCPKCKLPETILNDNKIYCKCCSFNKDNIN